MTPSEKSMTASIAQSADISQMAEMLDEAVMLATDDGVIVSANAAGLRLFDETVIGRPVGEVIADAEFSAAFTKAAVDHANLEIAYQPKNQGIDRDFRIRLKRLGDGPVVLLFLDLTRQRNLENVRRDFVANVSHELRSPLTSLAGFIETMIGGDVPDEAMRLRFLGIMDEEAKRMSRLIDDLLSLSRVEVDEHIVPDNKVKLLDVIHTVRDSLAGRAAQRGMNIEILDQRENRAEEAVMLGSFDEITEVFVNIFENAIKYGFAHTPISVAIFEVSANRLQIDVINHGEGIEQRHLSRLTERFYRVDRARSRQIGGTGLGLAIVKHIVNRHRGTLAVSSRLNETTKFSVVLPLIKLTK
jgi:two-component system phosphate regulon sensor histidine kinase PhoR